MVIIDLETGSMEPIHKFILPPKHGCNNYYTPINFVSKSLDAVKETPFLIS